MNWRWIIGGAVVLTIASVIAYDQQLVSETTGDASPMSSLLSNLDLITNPLEGSIPETNPVAKTNPFIFANQRDAVLSASAAVELGAFVSKKFLERESGPGGCTTGASCESYCNSIAHAEECISFAEESGLWAGERLAEAKRVRDTLRRGVRPPGGCMNREECEAYCADPNTIEECVLFGRVAGFISEAQARDFLHILPLVKSGRTPGECRSRSSCDAYCGDERHIEECAEFAKEAGLLSMEEAIRVRRIGGHGPGGCRDQEQCETFCRASENQRTCLEFAAQRGLISVEDFMRLYEEYRYADVRD